MGDGDAATRQRRIGAAGLVRLRLIATSDLHMHIMPWDYLSARPAPDRGLAALATLIAAARAEVPNSLLLDNGDFVQGSALGDFMADGRPAIPAHPMIAAMNHLGYDAATLGNHEFSHGLSFLSAALMQAAFPVVASNLHDRDPQNLFDDAPLPRVKNKLILDRAVLDEAGRTHRLRIGILGLLPPQTTVWERQTLSDRFEVEDIPAAAARTARDLRSAGADLVFALAHSGIGTDPATPRMENATRALAAQGGIDAIVAGHSHLLFPSPSHPVAEGIDSAKGLVSQTPVVLPGAYGTHLGVIDLVIEQRPDGWRVLSQRAALRAVQDGPDAPPAPPDPALSALAAPAHRATLDWLEQPVGRVEAPTGTAFALVAPCHLLRVVTAAAARHVADALAGTGHAHLPVLAAAAPFRAGGRGGPDHYTLIRPGALTLRQAIDIYPHPNGIAALRITGAEVADWLERAAGLFCRLRAGKPDQPLIQPDFAPFNFDMIDGLDFRIDLSQPSRFDLSGRVTDPAARRITGLTWRGAPIAPEAEFILATNSYRAAGGGNFPGTGPARVVYEDSTPVRDILIRHISARGMRLPPPVGQWGFAPLPGMTALFSTAPEAADFRADAAGLDLHNLGIGPCGFLRFRLAL